MEMEEFSGEVDWIGIERDVRIEKCKELFVAAKHVAAITGQSIEAMIIEALGGNVILGTDYDRNFQKGVIGAPRAEMIHEWLALNHFALAQSKAPELFQHERQSQWELFLQSHTVEGGLRAIPADQLGIASRKPPADGVATFRIGQPFVFELTAPKPAHVLAFEEYKGVWHPLPLGPDERHLIVKVQVGLSILPRDTNGSAIPLREYDDAGLHCFAFVLCDGPRPRTDQKGLVAHAEKEWVAVNQMKIRVTA